MADLEHDVPLESMLRTLRTTLHMCAEPSGKEVLTASIIAEFLTAYAPDALLTGLGGQGIAAVFDGDPSGPTVMARCEHDGLCTADGPAGAAGVAHQCGHDGHMAIVAGLAPLLRAAPPTRGRVALLFQPAEETGEGALRVLGDPRFAAVRPDFAVALHNLPGYPRHTVVYRAGVFASASVGMRVELRGLASHAAEPEQACTPTGALSRLLSEMPELSELGHSDYQLVTITHVRMGRESFGITPSQATLCATLRAASNTTLEALCAAAEHRVRDATADQGLDVDIAWTERFPETRNDAQLVSALQGQCAEMGVSALEVPTPFRWSEDFGHFAAMCPSVYFGLGIGEDAHHLHHPDYRFPDRVIPTGIRALLGLVRHLTA